MIKDHVTRRNKNLKHINIKYHKTQIFKKNEH